MSTSIPAYRSNSASPPSSSRKAVKASATASASSSRAPTRASTDPFYGHEGTSLLCSRFITSLFQCPNVPIATEPGTPTPSLPHFVGYALHRTRLPSIVTFAALLLLQRLKARFPAARGSSGHRLFISAFMIASKVICDDTYSNQSWGIVAQKMFALKEINQMEREMCGYLEWNLNVMGEEVVELEEMVRAEHGPMALAKANLYSMGGSALSPPPLPTCYPTPESTPDPGMITRPIRPVPSPYRSMPSHQPLSTSSLPSPPSPALYLHPSHSPQSPHFASGSSSLASSPASDDCKTPSPVTHTSSGASRSHFQKGVDMSRVFEGRQRQHATNIALTYPINVGGW